MAYKSLRDWLAKLEEAGELKRITAEVDWNLELSAIAQQVQDEEGQEKRKIELGKKLHNNWTSVESSAEDLIDKSVSLLEEPIINNR